MFDCIILNDVLEHLVDPFEALLYCRELLNSQGRVVASIPNVRYFDNIWNLLVHKNWEYTDWGILDKTHLRFFTKRSILSTFSDLDYDIETIDGINPLPVLHPHHVKRFRLLNRILWNKLEDMNYLQFAVVVSPKNTEYKDHD
jgi:2-polyprenyl-3-methyl-5-hydroxy-6-metoxy-1,4-benzoquinol methylase